MYPQMTDSLGTTSYPAPVHGALGESQVALMGMALSQTLPWPQCFPVSQDIFSLYSNVPKR